MDRSSENRTRKEALTQLVVLPALAALFVGGTGIAEAKGSKSAFKYQDKPNAGNECDKCTFFIPGKSKTAAGGCKLVDGSISPKGWCTAYAPKG